jgi:hypothetical protein
MALITDTKSSGESAAGGGAVKDDTRKSPIAYNFSLALVLDAEAYLVLLVRNVWPGCQEGKSIDDSNPSAIGT